MGNAPQQGLQAEQQPSPLLTNQSCFIKVSLAVGTFPARRSDEVSSQP